MRTPLATCLLLAAGLAACRIPSEPASGFPDSVSAVDPEQRVARGETLYGRHCAVCHGPEGRGDGPAAPHLFPAPRRFPDARFRLVSSANGAPFDRDLVATLRRGVPGSAMPGFGWLPEEDLWSLAAFVRFLSVEGLRADLQAHARASGDPLLLAGAERIARERLTPDRALARPGPVSDAAETRARGAEVFHEHCAGCHGEDGRGEPDPRENEDGSLNWARDLTAGFWKGGSSPAELACRIRAGMPGSAMPPTALAPGDERALLAFLRGIVPPGSADRLVHRRSNLLAHRVARVPATPDDPAWEAADEIDVVLAPLWWSPGAVLGASLAALHDGTDVALRLSWDDATGALRIFAAQGPCDGAALQLSDAVEPALFGMGSPDAPTNLWHWQALRPEEVAGALDLLDPTPHLDLPVELGPVRADVPRYQRLLSRVAPSESAERVTVEGIASLRAAARVTGEVRCRARWEGGRWSVVFTRARAASGADQVPLGLGTPVQVACAVWNGANGDQGPRKSISIWQELVLEP